MCSLRDAAAEFAELGCKVFGVSLDDVQTVAKFAEQEELNFPLLSDPDASAAAKYDVLAEKARWASRVTFVLDGKGVVRWIDEEVSVSTHGTDLVAKIRELQR